VRAAQGVDAAVLLDELHLPLGIEHETVQKRHLVERPGNRPLQAGAIIAPDIKDQRVVQVAHLLDGIQQSALSSPHAGPARFPAARPALPTVAAAHITPIGLKPSRERHSASPAAAQGGNASDVQLGPGGPSRSCTPECARMWRGSCR
jgi:hypothetical protein